MLLKCVNLIIQRAFMKLFSILKIGALLKLATSAEGKITDVPAKDHYKNLINNPYKATDSGDLYNNGYMVAKAGYVEGYSHYINALTRADAAASLDLCVNPNDPSHNTYVDCAQTNPLSFSKAPACQKLKTLLRNSPGKTVEGGSVFNGDRSFFAHPVHLKNFNENTVDILQTTDQCNEEKSKLSFNQ